MYALSSIEMWVTRWLFSLKHESLLWWSWRWAGRNTSSVITKHNYRWTCGEALGRALQQENKRSSTHCPRWSSIIFVFWIVSSKSYSQFGLCFCFPISRTWYPIRVTRSSQIPGSFLSPLSLMSFDLDRNLKVWTIYLILYSV